MECCFSSHGLGSYSGETAMNNPRDRCRRLALEAEGYLELGMHHHALHSLEQLEASGALDAHAVYLKGETLRSLERYDEALSALCSASRSLPDDIHILLALGWCYKRTGQLDRAIDSLEDALLVEPSEALVHYNLACYWSLAGNKESALTFLATAFDIDSSYRDMVEQESDFDPIRSDPDFLALTSVIV